MQQILPVNSEITTNPHNYGANLSFENLRDFFAVLVKLRSRIVDSNLDRNDVTAMLDIGQTLDNVIRTMKSVFVDVSADDMDVELDKMVLVYAVLSMVKDCVECIAERDLDVYLAEVLEMNEDVMERYELWEETIISRETKQTH